MGISRACAQLILDDHARRRLRGDVLLLGRQDCVFGPDDLRRWARARGLPLREEALASPPDARRSASVSRRGIEDRRFFEALGCGAVESVDLSTFEGASVAHDLNRPLPEALRGRFDVVFNGGTLEHVFHLPQALANVHDALRVGGRVMHLAPVSNQIDHGFYGFSPVLFADYYAANGYEVATSLLFQGRDWESPWTVYRYAPGALDALVGRFHDVRASGVTMVGLFFVAEKTATSTGDAIPQQGQYARAWSSAEAPPPPEPPPALRALRDLKRRLDRALPALNPRAMPPRVARYR